MPLFPICKMSKLALAGVAQWVVVSSCAPKVAGSILSQGTYLSFKFNPWSVFVQEAAD